MKKFIDRGNLGADPELRELESGDVVAQMRVYFDRPAPTGEDGSFTDQGGFWLTVEIWGERARVAARHLRKGVRVAVEGSLIQKTWTDDDGHAQARMIVRAAHVDPDLGWIDEVRFRESRGESQDAAA